MKRFLMIAIAIMATTLTGATAASAPDGGGGGALAGADSVWCGDLTSFSITEGTVTSAEVVETGAFTPPVAPGGRAPSRASVTRTYGALPAFCRVVATLRPTNDSNITIEVWMPLSGWNGKYQAVGNGAFSGIDSVMDPWLPRWPTATRPARPTRGISATRREFGLDHPEKVVDFGWRSLHLMAVVAKEVIAAHYDESSPLLLLEWVFRRWPPGDEDGAGLSLRLRRHRGRSTGPGLERTCSRSTPSRHVSGIQPSRPSLQR